MADRRGGAHSPPTEATVKGADWDGHDVSGQIHTRVAFVDPDLTEVRNTGAIFTECTFRRARFNCSVHIDAAFVNCAFLGCSFFDTTFTGCKFVGSSFDRCTYELMTVDGGNWSFVGLPGADLRKASFNDLPMVRQILPECGVRRERFAMSTFRVRGWTEPTSPVAT